MVKDDVLLVAGNLTSISASASEVWKKDVVDSVLFSQLYASSKTSKFSGPQKWYKNYTEAMSQAKWKTGSFKFSGFELDDGESIVLNALVQKRIGSIVGFPPIEQFERLMCSIQQDSAAETIASLTEEYAMVCQVEGETSDVSTVVLHVSLVGHGPAIYSAFVYFKTAQAVERNIFHQKFKSELIVGEISIGISQLVLNKDAYERARMREKIHGSLPEVTAPLVLNITATCDDQLR